MFTRGNYENDEVKQNHVNRSLIMFAAITHRVVLTTGMTRQEPLTTRIPFSLVQIWLELKTQSLRHLPHGRYVNSSLSRLIATCIV